MSSSGLALVYVRLSSNKVGEATVSPEKQLEACIAVCEQRGWMYETYKDLEGWRSGRFEANRPAWLALKARLAKGGVAAVVVYRLDRASRSPKDFFNFMGLLQDQHADLVSATQDIDTSTPYGRMFVGLLSLWAALEAEITSERVRETVHWKQAHGIHVGDVPLGYDREKRSIAIGTETVTTSVLVPNEAEARIVREAFECYATGNYTYRTLADHLNAAGYRTKHKSRGPGLFTHKSIQVILGNHQLYRGYVVRNEGEGDEEAVKGVHAAIVNDAVVQAVRLRATSWHDRIPLRSHQKRLFILSGLHCAICGAELRGITERNGQPVYRHAGIKGGCPVVQADAERLEAAFLNLFDGLEFSDDEVREWLQYRARTEAPKAPDQQKRLDYLDQRGTRAKRLYLAGDLSEREYQAERRSIDKQREDLLAEAAQSTPDTAAQMVQVIRNFGQAIQTTNAEAQRRMVAAMMERIETNGEAITRIVPRHWFREFLTDLARLQSRADQGGVKGYPQGTLSRGLDAMVWLFAERPVSVPRTVSHNTPQPERNAMIRELKRQGVAYVELADRYGVSVARIGEICKGA